MSLVRWAFLGIAAVGLGGGLTLLGCGSNDACFDTGQCPSGFSCVPPAADEGGNACVLSCTDEGACAPGYVCADCVGLTGPRAFCASACLPLEDPRLPPSASQSAIR